MHQVLHRDLDPGQFGELRLYLDHFVNIGGELSRANLIMTTKLLHKWKEGKRVADGERVGVKSTVLRTVEVYFIVISGN